jgi:hypothetical protein
VACLLGQSHLRNRFFAETLRLNFYIRPASFTIARYLASWLTANAGVC